MSFVDDFLRKIKYGKRREEEQGELCEYCPRCEAILTLQPGFDSSLPYWVCRGCGMPSYGSDVDGEESILWICDGCEDLLNNQEGFSEDCGEWKCLRCGRVNRIAESEVYESEAEYRETLHDPYKGLSEEAVLEISMYEEICGISGREDVILMRDPEDKRFYVKKILKDYNRSVYQYLMEHPVAHMPRLFGVYEGCNNLIVIEEFIDGVTLSEMLRKGPISLAEAIRIIKEVCRILVVLHGLAQPIIHRDIKPSNVMISEEGEVYLLDMNVAKWYRQEEVEDTKLYGTLYYAAPEQLGYGFSASSAKSDIYAVGILLNVLLTGKMPKEEKASGPIWSIIERCISLEPKDRYTATELIVALEGMGVR